MTVLNKWCLLFYYPFILMSKGKCSRDFEP